VIGKAKKSHATVSLRYALLLMPSFPRALVLLDRSHWQKPTQVNDVLQINYISEIYFVIYFYLKGASSVSAEPI
jgi:hypothetical protein